MATCGDLDFEARNIQFLEFELSNQCQLAGRHPWCPRHHLGTNPAKCLPTPAVCHVVEFFAAYDFSGTVYLSLYNEPLLDSRTPTLIAYVRKTLPKCLVQMYSNGLALTPDLARRLVAAGLGMFRLSVYAETRGRVNPAALDILAAGGVYLAPIERNGPESYGAHGWDERQGIYDRDAGCRAPCYMPIQYFCVNCYGAAMLCWDDWRSTVTFGNVLTDSMDSILLHPARLAKLAALKAGRRDGACRGCARPTELCISEYRDRLRLA
jgi:MoaA/NifB/PqqE/SkfB family radical SAM enzyme